MPLTEMERLIENAITAALERLDDQARARDELEKRRRDLAAPFIEALSDLSQQAGIALSVDAVIGERPGSYDEIRITVEDDEGHASGQLDAALNEGVLRWREEHGGLRSPGPSPMVSSGLGFPVGLMEPSATRSLIDEAIPRAKELAAARDA